MLLCQLCSPRLPIFQIL